MIDRRQFIAGLAASSAMGQVSAAPLLRRVIPSSGEAIPAVGMGTWLTFDVGDNAHQLRVRQQVLEAFFEGGGSLIDSSPMYGTSEATLGRCLDSFEDKPTLFAATKVWTPGRWLGIKQMKNSAALWRMPRLDLMQIHNLLDWKSHLPTLKSWKSEGRFRYIGITTSHGRRHREIAELLRTEPLDFVQLTYNLLDREAEQQLIPIAMERGIAVIANRPFQGSRLFDRVRNAPLPGWAKEIQCTNWAQVFLKFILSHRGVTCAIPATSRVDHMLENIGALHGELPDPRLRRRILDDYLHI